MTKGFSKEYLLLLLLIIFLFVDSVEERFEEILAIVIIFWLISEKDLKIE